jgi:hypothetical protein
MNIFNIFELIETVIDKLNYFDRLPLKGVSKNFMGAVEKINQSLKFKDELIKRYKIHIETVVSNCTTYTFNLSINLNTLNELSYIYPRRSTEYNTKEKKQLHIYYTKEQFLIYLCYITRFIVTCFDFDDFVITFKKLLYSILQLQRKIS